MIQGVICHGNLACSVNSVISLFNLPEFLHCSTVSSLLQLLGQVLQQKYRARCCTSSNAPTGEDSGHGFIAPQGTGAGSLTQGIGYATPRFPLSDNVVRGQRRRATAHAEGLSPGNLNTHGREIYPCLGNCRVSLTDNCEHTRVWTPLVQLLHPRHSPVTCGGLQQQLRQ